VDDLERVFSPEDFMPHGVCFLWNAKLLWLHALSDALTFAAYLTIPFTPIYFARYSSGDRQKKWKSRRADSEPCATSSALGGYRYE
jgi:hypothetical protein